MDEERSPADRFKKYLAKGKQLIGEGKIQEALACHKKALQICHTDKLARKIEKMEAYLSACGDESEEEEEDNGMVHLGKGFYLYKDLHASLYAHQQEGVLWMWSLFRRKKGGILGDDMGLGKTIQVIAFLSGMFDMQKIQSVLIVLPVAVMVNWEKEFNKWAPGLKVVAFHGNSKREKERALMRVQRRGGICLTTYGLVVTSWEQLGQRNGSEFIWDYMILDEGHKIKNPTKTSKGVHAIPAHNRIILTGTPVQNNLKELWALFDFVHQGSLLGTQRTFKMEFDNPITRAREKDATVGEKKLGMEMAETLKGMIAPFFLRRTKAEVKEQEKQGRDQPVDQNIKCAIMPDMTRKNDLIVWTFLGETQLSIYQDFLSLDSVKELLMTTKSPLVALNVLKKICDHPRLLSTRACAQLGVDQDEGVDEELLETETGSLSAVTRIQHIPDDTLVQESGKLLFLMQLLDRLKFEGHRCLVFSQSRRMLDIMQKVFTNKGHKIMRLDGTISSVQEREARIQKFQTDSSYNVFLLTTQVGGVGLTLTAADRVVIYDPSWNPATDAQAVDRVFRIGQDKNVVIYRLITCATVEEKIYRRQIFKDSITRQTTGNSKNPYRYFSKYELRELFTMDDPKSSTTQQQLEAMHSGQRLTDPSLDEHIAYLYSLEMFGLSDHDLMFSQGGTGGEEQDEDDGSEVGSHDAETDYIQNRAQKARELIQMESEQGNSLEERLGKGPQQGSVAGRFQNWNIPPQLPNTGRGEEDVPGPSMVDLTNSPDVKVNTSNLPWQPKKEESSPSGSEDHEDMEEHVISSDEDDENRMETGTPAKTPIKTPAKHARDSTGMKNLAEEFNSLETSQKELVSPKTPSRKDVGTVEEQIIISPDPRTDMIKTRPSSSANSSFTSLPNVTNFNPMFNSTTMSGTGVSPNTSDQNHSKGFGLNRSSNEQNQSSRKPFQTIVGESPLLTSNTHQRNSSSTDNSALENEIDNQVSVIEDSLVISDDEDKENIEPGNISVTEIKGILEKSLNSTRANHSIVAESPVVKKSRRKSTAFKRRVIESSDEEDETSERSVSPANEENDDGVDEIDGGDGDENDYGENDMDGHDDDDDGYIDHTGDENGEETEKDNDDSQEQHFNTSRARESNNEENRESNSSVTSGNVNEVSTNVEDNEHGMAVEEHGNEENTEGEVSHTNEGLSESIEDGEDHVDEEEDMEEEEEGGELEFEDLPEEDQMEYNELVERGRVLCQQKEYETGLVCVLQALEIYEDVDLQKTAMQLQKKVLKQQARAKQNM
ncbi:DNA excision repair protein ERCC-6-like [Mya arenaria]|uniref:DNA excision repair protein ERCC-6-like n=1 Tax=Mya arenaria TaxID=6604 RepID=UPI0022E3E3D9|nr:DNA excision repair protein ERCC-6-like [Mya arenaria]